MAELAKCANRTHPDYLYAVEKLGEQKTLFMYDKLGQEIPTKEQVDSITSDIQKKTVDTTKQSPIKKQIAQVKGGNKIITQYDDGTFDVKIDEESYNQTEKSYNDDFRRREQSIPSIVDDIKKGKKIDEEDFRFVLVHGAGTDSIIYDEGLKSFVVVEIEGDEFNIVEGFKPEKYDKVTTYDPGYDTKHNRLGLTKITEKEFVKRLHYVNEHELKDNLGYLKLWRSEEGIKRTKDEIQFYYDTSEFNDIGLLPKGLVKSTKGYTLRKVAGGALNEIPGSSGAVTGYAYYHKRSFLSKTKEELIPDAYMFIDRVDNTGVYIRYTKVQEKFRGLKIASLLLNRVRVDYPNLPIHRTMITNPIIVKQSVNINGVTDKEGNPLPTFKNDNEIKEWLEYHDHIIIPSLNQTQIQKKTIFQSPQSVIQEISQATSIIDIENALLGYKGIINSKRHLGKVYVKAQYEFTTDHVTLAKQLQDQINEVYPGLIDVVQEKQASKDAQRGVWVVKISEYAWNKYVHRNDDVNYQQGILFKNNEKDYDTIKDNEIGYIRNFLIQEEETTSVYDVLDHAEKFFDNVSDEHKDLFQWVKEIQQLNPNVGFESLSLQEAKNKFPDQIEDNDYAFYHTRTNGVYIVKDNVINRLYSDQSIFLGNVMHETIHAFTAYPFNKSPEKRSQLEADYVYNIEKLFHKAKQKTRYGNRNAYKVNAKEFIADGLSDQRIIDELKTMYDPKVKLTVLEQIKQWILRLLGKSPIIESYHYQLFSLTQDYIYKTSPVRPNSGQHIIESKKISDNIYVQKDNPTHTEMLDALQKTQETYDALDIRFEGITHMMSRLRLGSVPYEMLSKDDQVESDKYSKLGTQTHFHMEKSFSNVIDRLKGEYELSPQAVADLSKVFDSLKKPGVTILSEVRVADFANKMVAVIDLMVIDKDNNIHTFEFKTKVGGFEHFDVDFTAKKGQPMFRPFSDYKKAGVQMTVGKNMIEEITKGTVTSMHIIPLKPIVNFETKTVESYKIDTSFNGKSTIPIEHSDWVKALYTAQTISMNPEDHQDNITEEQRDMLKETSERFKAQSNKDVIMSSERRTLLRIIQSLENRMDIDIKHGKGDLSSQLKFINGLLDAANTDIDLALDSAIDQAYVITKRASDQIEKLEKENKEFTPALLAGLKESVAAFDVLDEYAPIFVEKYGVDQKKIFEIGLTDKERSNRLLATQDRLDKAIKYKEFVKNKYETIGLELIAEFIYPHYNKVKVEYRDKYKQEYRDLKWDKEHGALLPGQTFNEKLTIEEYVNSKMNAEKETIDTATKTAIRKELKRAALDISKIEALADNILDSPDAVTAAMVKAFVMADNTKRIEIERTRLEMLPTINEWNDYAKQFGNNYQKAYEFMIEKDLKTGEATGHVVAEFHSDLMKQYYQMMAVADAIGDDEFNKVYEKSWKDENAPLDENAYRVGFLSYVETLLKEGKITQEEYDIIVYNSRTSGSYVKDNDLNISDNAKELIKNWRKTQTWSYRHPASKWINPQWSKLKKILDDKNDPRTKMYNLILDTQERADALVPVGVKLGTRFPGVIKQKNERLASGHGIINTTKESLSKSLNFKVDDTHRVKQEIFDLEGKAKYFVPIHFTGRVTKIIKEGTRETSVFDPNEQSFDLANIYFNYLASAIDFNWKNDVLPEMEMHRFLLNNRDIVQRDGMNNKIVRLSRVFTGQETELDEKTIKGGNIADQYNTWLLYALYEQAEKDMGVIPGTNIDAGKLIGSINKFTALNLLGLNVVAGFANVALGETLQWIEAFAEHHIGKKEYTKAIGYYTKNMPGFLGDIGSTKPKNIVSLLLREFNVLHDSKTRNLTDKRFASLLRVDAVFFTNHVGEHSMQGKFLLAMLAKQRAYDINGIDIGSILDNYEVKNGVLKLSDKVDHTKIDGIKTIWDNTNRRIFEHRVLGLLTRIHGAYSDLERVALQQNSLGSMAYMFRKFIVPGARRRWGARRYEERTEEFVEGNYRSMMRFVGQLYKDLRAHKAVALSKRWATMGDYEKANIIRSVGEISALLAMIVLAAVAVKFAGDDDREDDIFWNFVAYQTLRLKAELLFFTSPAQAMKILRSPAASVSVINNTLELATQVFGPGWQDYQQGPWKDHMKIEKTLIDMTIGVRQYYRLRDIGSQVNLWKSGSTASQ
jgi:hypothetical protein